MGIRDQLISKTSQTPESESYEWELDMREIEFTKSLGSGVSGEVFRGSYRTRTVAIKVLKANTEESEIAEFIKEFAILVNVKSPYIVSFIGATLTPRLCMVMEFCEKGSLYKLLNEIKFPFYWTTAILFAKEIILGIDALHTHEPIVIHRDLKTLNVLVTKDYHCKLADFGLSRTDTTTNLNSLIQTKGTYAYIAPESYSNVKVNASSDIYSYSIIFWEIFTRLIKKKKI